MNVKELLVKARGRIDKPQKWCSYWWRSKDGRKLGVDGAIWEASEGDRELEVEAFHILAEYSGVDSMWGTDQARLTHLHKHTEVMGMFDKAIASLR